MLPKESTNQIILLEESGTFFNYLYLPEKKRLKKMFANHKFWSKNIFQKVSPPPPHGPPKTAALSQLGDQE